MNNTGLLQSIPVPYQTLDPATAAPREPGTYEYMRVYPSKVPGHIEIWIGDRIMVIPALMLFHAIIFYCPFETPVAAPPSLPPTNLRPVK